MGNNRKGFVYFVEREDGAVKIGYTRNAKSWASRWADLRGHTYKATKFLGRIESGKAGEKILHWYFSHRHINKEWFEPDPDMLRLIDEYGTLEMPTYTNNYSPMRIPKVVHRNKWNDSYSASEVACLYQVSHQTIYTWIKNDVFPNAYKNSTHKIPYRDLNDAAKANILEL